MNASDREQIATLERTQAKAKKLKHERLADLLPENHSVGYELKQWPDTLAAFVKFRRDS